MLVFNAGIAQEEERILSKDEVSDRNFLPAPKVTITKHNVIDFHQD